MRRALATLALLVVPGAASSGCGLTVTGSLAEADRDASSPSTGTEAGADAGVEPIPVTVCGETTCGLAVPSGWSFAVVANSTTPCPAGFTTTDVIEKPVASAAACACSCTVTGSPSCTTGSVVTKYDSSTGAGTCNQTSNALVAEASGRCVTTNLANGEHELFPSPLPSGTAKCAAAVAPNKAGVESEASRICTPPTCAAACDGAALKMCLVRSGEHDCPTEAPEKHVVGTDVEVSCPACGCTATPPAACAGTWTLYSDQSCATLVDTVPANVCTDTTDTTIRSYKWTPVPTPATCTPVPKAGAPTLVAKTTLCCK